MIINGERSLAYIAKITDIQPILDADKIEVVTVNDGWKVVVAKKDNFKIGDEVIYIEIDSKVPEIPEFEFLKDRKYRVKTIRLRKQYSQGLVIPKYTFAETKDIPLGKDVSKLIGITYYVPEDNQRKASSVDPNMKYKRMSARHSNLAKTFWWRWLMKRQWGKDFLFVFFGKKRDTPKAFPKQFPYVHKTDEERIENLPELLGYKNPLIVTEKLDGTPCTYILERKRHKFRKDTFEFYVTSRNVRQLDEDQKTYHEKNIYWELAKKYDIETKLFNFLDIRPNIDYVCIQGEGVGSVQGNPLKLEEDELYVFNFIDSHEGRWASNLGRDLIETWGMKWVPILDMNYHMPNDMEEFKQYADGKSVVNPKVNREGLVLRDPVTDLSFKNVSRKYILSK